MSKNKLDKFQELMFRDISEITTLTYDEKQQLLRYRFIFTFLLEDPSMSDSLLKDNLMSEYGISQSQAYRDLSNIRIILPNVRNAGKEWHRYIVNEELKKAISDAKTSNKLKERIMAITAYGKFNRLDQIDEDPRNWGDLIPLPIEPTTDPTVLGVTPLENRDQEIKTLLAKYKGDIEIDDIDYQDIKDGSDKEDLL